MKLLSPIAIGSMQLKNRIVMSPMTTNYGNEDQSPSQRLIDFLVARAKGGAGLITVEVCTVDVGQKYQPQSLTLGSDEFIEPHRRLTDALHQYGARVQPQITHPGPESMCSVYFGEQAVGPSVCLGASTGWPSRALQLHELDGIVESYAQAARRAREAGYDGIELHAAHGYMLLGTFLSPWKNRREDEYGAQTMENRTRLLVRVIRRIKAVAGSDFPITLRCSGFERQAGGRDSYDMARVAPLLVAAGIDAFHVSGGVSDVLVSQIVCGNEFANGYNVPAAQAIKRVVDVPVMVVGRIHDPEHAEQILQQQRADMIVMARPLLADPELPNKVAAGRLDEIRRCISCQNCIDSMLLWPMESKMACALNAASGREAQLQYTPAVQRKHVVVIGSGAGGMEAARVAAERGHRVTLLEQRLRLGGSLTLASTVHPDNERFLQFLIRRMHALPIDIRLGVRADTALLQSLGADEVIVASGARLHLPQIEGLHLPHVVTGVQLRQLADGRIAAPVPAWSRAAVQLGGRLVERFATPRLLRRMSAWWLPLGRRIVIAGADLAAIELAEFLAARGRDVAILHAQEVIAPEIGPKRRLEHEKRLEQAGVTINTGVDIRRICAAGVEIHLANGSMRLIGADNVVVPGEPVADTALFDAVRAAGFSAHAVGDCTGPGLIVKAVREAAMTASAL